MNMQVVGPEHQAQLERARIAKQRLYGSQSARNMALVFKLEAQAKEASEQAEKRRLETEAQRKRAEEISRRWLAMIRDQMVKLREQEEAKIRALKAIPMRKIITISGRLLGFDSTVLIGTSRKKPRVIARQITMWIAYRVGKKSLAEIGRKMERHHSTILHGIQCIDALLEEGCPHTGRKVKIIKEALM